MTRFKLLVLMVLSLCCVFNTPCKAYNLFTQPEGRCGSQFDSAAVLTLKGAFFCKDTKDSLEGEITLYRIHPGQKDTVEIGKRKGKTFLFELKSGYQYYYKARAEDHLYLPWDKKRVISASGIKNDTIRRLNISLEHIRPDIDYRLPYIFFEKGSSEIQEDQYSDLKGVVKFLRENPRIKIEIQGHMDKNEVENYRRQIARERGKVVVDYLVEQGIDPKRLGIQGYGALRPIATNETEAGRKKNRRVEFHFIEVEDTNNNEERK